MEDIVTKATEEVIDICARHSNVEVSVRRNLVEKCLMALWEDGYAQAVDDRFQERVGDDDR